MTTLLSLYRPCPLSAPQSSCSRNTGSFWAACCLFSAASIKDICRFGTVVVPPYHHSFGFHCICRQKGFLSTMGHTYSIIQGIGCRDAFSRAFCNYMAHIHMLNLFETSAFACMWCRGFQVFPTLTSTPELERARRQLAASSERLKSSRGTEIRSLHGADTSLGRQQDRTLLRPSARHGLWGNALDACIWLWGTLWSTATATAAIRQVFRSLKLKDPPLHPDVPFADLAGGLFGSKPQQSGSLFGSSTR